MDLNHRPAAPGDNPTLTARVKLLRFRFFFLVQRNPADLEVWNSESERVVVRTTRHESQTPVVNCYIVVVVERVRPAFEFVC
jgi:hypothetical protein